MNAMAVHKRQQARTVASVSGNKFTAKQSKFARNEEEKQVLAASGNGSTAEVSRFERSRRNAASSRPDDNGAFAAPRPSASSSAMAPHATRERKQDRFALGDTDEPRHAGKRSRDNDSVANRDALGALLGNSTRTLDSHADKDLDVTAEDSGKKSKWERFQDVMEKSKALKAQNFREKTLKEKETSALDTEFTSVMHLLSRRDKVDEQKQEFDNSVKPEIRQLLTQFRPEGRKSRMMTLVSKPVTPDAPAPQVAVRNISSQGMTEENVKLLARINSRDPALRVPKDIRGIPKVAPSSAVEMLESRPVGFGDDAGEDEGDAEGVQERAVGRQAAVMEDDFDKLMSIMRMETRIAKATDRVLSNEEEEVNELQQSILASDRQAAPKLNVDGKDISRKEWINQGGDNGHMMEGAEDEEEEGEEDEEDMDDIVSEEDEDDFEVDEATGQLVKISEGTKSHQVAEEEEDEEVAAAAALIGPAFSTTSSALQKSHLHPIDRLLARLEELVENYCTNKQQVSPVVFRKQIDDLTYALYDECRTNAAYGAQSARLILMDLQNQASKSAFTPSQLSSYRMMLIFVLLHIYPTSDYRHPITTPLVTLICSIIMRAALITLEDARIVVLLSSMLTNAFERGGQKYAAEPLAGLLNVVALQASRAEIEPKRFQGSKLPVPFLLRTEQPILALASTEKPAIAVDPVSLTRSLPNPRTNGPNDAKLSVLTSVYQSLMALVDMISKGVGPSVTYTVVDPILKVLEEVLPSTPNGATSRNNYSASLNKYHNDLLEKLEEVATKCKDNRTPLAMRTFRTRPLRQFEPLLVAQENEEMHERKMMKRMHRDERKHLVRNVQAEASVDRRAREKEHDAIDKRREGKYNELITDLQKQQHIMKTVDSLMVKARSKKRGNISGEADNGGGEE